MAPSPELHDTLPLMSCRHLVANDQNGGVGVVMQSTTEQPHLHQNPPPIPPNLVPSTTENPISTILSHPTWCKPWSLSSNCVILLRRERGLHLHFARLRDLTWGFCFASSSVFLRLMARLGGLAMELPGLPIRWPAIATIITAQLAPPPGEAAKAFDANTTQKFLSIVYRGLRGAFIPPRIVWLTRRIQSE